MNSNRNSLEIPGIIFVLSNLQRKSDGNSSKFVYKASNLASSPNTHLFGIQASIVYPPTIFFHSPAVLHIVPWCSSRARGKSKMAVSPYVSRAELWLANAAFRPSFRLPEHFHPSIFLKWFPGHMAKGKLFTTRYFLLQNRHDFAAIFFWKLRFLLSLIFVKLT